MNPSEPTLRLWRSLNTNKTQQQEYRRYLESQKPKDLHKLTDNDLLNRYTYSNRRGYCPAIDILVYWEFRLDHYIDWGEPECLGCRQFHWSGISGNSNYHIWDNLYEKAHIVDACYGGPAQAWNLVYLCHWCHQEFDRTTNGIPKNYDYRISWIKRRRSVVLSSLIEEVHKYPETLKFWSHQEPYNDQWGKMHHRMKALMGTNKVKEIVRQCYDSMHPIQAEIFGQRLALQIMNKTKE
jgi:hypothetical protein